MFFLEIETETTKKTANKQMGPNKQTLGLTEPTKPSNISKEV